MRKNPVILNLSKTRPLRVDQGVVLGRVDPPYMEAGIMGTWKLSLVVDRDLDGESLVLRMGGHRWVKLDMTCQNEDPSGEGYISASAGGRPLDPVPRPHPERIHEMMVVRFRIPQEGIGSGEEIDLLLGDKSGGGPGLPGPRFAVRNVFMSLELEPKPEGMPRHEFNWVGAFVLDHTGGPYHSLRILGPSQIGPDEDFSLTIRPQDSHGNISTESPQKIVLTHDEFRNEVDVTDEMFNPGGAIEVGGIRLSKAGIARIVVEDPEKRIMSSSNPIMVGDFDLALRWGLIHEHTEISDGSGSLDSCYRNMRYGSRLDFGAASDHDHRFETSDEMWEMTREAARRHNIPGEFTALLGYEWAKWRRNGDGDRNVYYPHDDGRFIRSEDGECDTPRKLFDALADEALIIPHHTAYTGNFCDWTQHDPGRERLVEIYSVWGSSETSAANGNPLPVRTVRDFDPKWIEISGKKPTLAEEPVGFVQNALAQGWRVGFTAGGDMHKSHPGEDVTRGYPPHEYGPGITGLWAWENTRSSIFDSLHSRRCYATTGERMIIRMTVNGHPMGSELMLAGDKNRHIEGEVHGTDAIGKIEIIRNNKVVRVEDGDGMHDLAIIWDDDENLDAVALPPAPWSPKQFLFYYLRVTQIDGAMGWTSPVWIEKNKG